LPVEVKVNELELTLGLGLFDGSGGARVSSASAHIQGL